MKSEILYGTNPVLETLKAGKRKVFNIWLSKKANSQKIKNIEEIAEENHIKVSHEDGVFIKKISLTREHQGVAAKVEPYKTADFAQIIHKSLSNNGMGFIMILDQIIDPQNMGGIIRTGLCAGIDGIIISKKRGAPLSPAVSKASAGAMEHALISRVVNLTRTIIELKKANFRIIGADRNSKKTLFSEDISGSLAAVIGGEEKGIRRLIKENCDMLISIPQPGGFDSLNASVSAAIFMYEAVRKKLFSETSPINEKIH